jgi:hypothetical protein
MSDLDFENQLHSIAQKMDYPYTPDIVGRVMPHIQRVTKPRFLSNGWAWSLTIIIVLFFSLMLIPPARAAILEFIQIGIVRIFPRPTEIPIETPGTTAPETATPQLESSDLLLDLNRLAGETTLADAQESVTYQILLPPDLGAPDHVFVQDVEGAMTILVWLDPQDPEKILMSLHFIPEGSWAVQKFQPTVLQETAVRGRRAVWTVGPYFLILSNGNTELARLIDGNVLIWEEDGVTVRLEGNLALDTAMKIAETLQPTP